MPKTMKVSGSSLSSGSSHSSVGIVDEVPPPPGKVVFGKSRIPGFLTATGKGDLKKFGLNERSMEDWLRLQAEKVAAQRVTYKQGMHWSGSTQIYFATRRDTHSDIMCVTTTTRPCTISRCDDGSLPSDGFGLSVKEIMQQSVTFNGKNIPIGLVSSDIVPTLKKSMYSNPLRRPEEVKLEELDRKNRALWKEQAAFMLHLHAMRSNALETEIAAASVIQRNFRGFAFRKWLKKERHRLKVRRRMKRSYKVINRQVRMKLEMETNLKKAEERKRFASQKIQKTFRGWMARRISNKERYQRFEEINMWAATTIQGRVRIRLCRRAIKKLRKMHVEETRERAAITMQRVVRGIFAKRITAIRRITIQHIACIWIQRWFRRLLTRKVANKEVERITFELQNHAAIDMQRIYRGKRSRRVVVKLLALEKLEFQHANALTLQRCFRGHNGRVIFRDEKMRGIQLRQLHAIHTIQRVYHGMLGRKITEARRKILEEDIFAQCR